MIPTIHIEVKDKSLFAETILMPGDPLRAKFIADIFLDSAVQINSVRNMLGYTGFYKGKKVTVFGSGMGAPSIGIYSYELFKFYDVENIIRIGSAGTYSDQIKLYDIIIVKEAWSESTFAKIQNGYTEDIMHASSKLVHKIEEVACSLKIPFRTARVHSTDVFYSENCEYFNNIGKQHDCLAVEMETFALFTNAKTLNKKAAALLTISDSLLNRESIDSEKRQSSFVNMTKIALETVLCL